MLFTLDYFPHFSAHLAHVRDGKVVCGFEEILVLNIVAFEATSYEYEVLRFKVKRRKWRDTGSSGHSYTFFFRFIISAAWGDLIQRVSSPNCDKINATKPKQYLFTN